MTESQLLVPDLWKLQSEFLCDFVSHHSSLENCPISFLPSQNVAQPHVVRIAKYPLKQTTADLEFLHRILGSSLAKISHTFLQFADIPRFDFLHVEDASVIHFLNDGRAHHVVTINSVVASIYEMFALLVQNLVCLG